MNIKEMTEAELKALGYDQVKLLNQTQNNLQLIEQELINREKGSKEEDVKE